MNPRSYKPFDEWKWRSYDGKRRVKVEEFVESHKDDFFFIGTDSQNYSKKQQTIFTTALIAYKFRHGGSIVIHRDRGRFIDALRQRLLMEAMYSLEVAWFLDSKIPKESIIGIHLDVNRNLKFKSAQYKDELVGLIVAQGYNALIKPDAWAASSVADSRC